MLQASMPMGTIQSGLLIHLSRKFCNKNLSGSRSGVWKKYCFFVELISHGNWILNRHIYLTHCILIISWIYLFLARVLLYHGLGSEELLTTTPIEEPSYYSECGHEGHNLKKRVFGVRRVRFLECKCISSKKLHNGKPSNWEGKSERWLACSIFEDLTQDFRWSEAFCHIFRICAIFD